MSKGKQAIYKLSSEEDDVLDDDEDEEDSDFSFGQENEQEDSESHDEEEEPESLQEEYEVEEFGTDLDGNVESDESSDEDEECQSFSEFEINEDHECEGFDRIVDKQTDKDLCEKVGNLLRQRNKKLHLLKLDECKAYLRKHSLMISGTKSTCIQRILEHWRLKDGNGERLYPISSFVIDCTGDVCKGDIVMFKQKVYEKFDKVTRNGKVIGKRTIAGRVVKESYGSAKQQHTFTVEVLWSKGVRPLPSLYPLLVKGRNLYKYKTFRKRWDNESERSKILEEKHRRGATARRVRASTKSRISSGSKRQRVFDSNRHTKRLKKHSDVTPRRNGQQTSNANSRTKNSSKYKHSATISSEKYSKNHVTKASSTFGLKKFKTNTSSYTYVRQVDQRPTFQNLYNNVRPVNLHPRNNTATPQTGRERFHIPVNNYNHNAGHTVPLMQEPYNQLMHRGTANISQSNVIYASHFGSRSHLIRPYSASVSQYGSRSVGYFYPPDVYYEKKFARF